MEMLLGSDLWRSPSPASRSRAVTNTRPAQTVGAWGENGIEREQEKGKEADQAVIAVFDLQMYCGDICEVCYSPESAGTAIRGGIYCDR